MLNDDSAVRKELRHRIAQLEQLFSSEVQLLFFLRTSAIILIGPFLLCTQVVNVYQCVASHKYIRSVIFDVN